MPKGIYKRKPRKGKYSPGNIIESPTGTMKILEYFPKCIKEGRKNSRATIRFIESGYVANVQTSNILAGKVADRRKPTVYGVGYIGSDIRIPARGAGIVRRVYDLWANMLKRCYGPYKGQYEGVSADPRWHCFQTFLDTIVDVPGYLEWEQDSSMHLDKDIRIPGNAVYHRDACLFVPAHENVPDSSTRRWARD